MSDVSVSFDIAGSTGSEAAAVPNPSITIRSEHIWCRACGADVPVPHSMVCPKCQWSLELAGFPDSVVGLVFSTPGKLLVNKRLGICVAATDAEAHIHYSAKDTQVIPITELPTVNEDRSHRELSPSARLQAAARAALAGDVSAKWDSETLLEAAGSWALVSIGTMRSLLDEAVQLGWPEVVEWIALSAQEKAWRQAHAAAVAGDHQGLLGHLGELPGSGYRARVDLVMPFLSVALLDPTAWISALSLDEDSPGEHTQVIRDILQGPSSTGIARLGALLGDNGWPERGSYWRSAGEHIEVTATDEITAQACPRWVALFRYYEFLGGRPATRSEGSIATLPAPLIDDLIDMGSLTPDSNLSEFPTDTQRYMRGRLRPATLTAEDLIQLGHYRELARRALIDENTTLMGTIGDGDDRVAHYRELLKVVRKRPYDADVLQEDAAQLILLAERARKALASGATSQLPGPVLREPTLWRLFEAEAQQGSLAPGSGDPVEFVHWAGLHRLLGLLWEGAWDAAIGLGESLIETLTIERFQDEALNLTAFAMTRRGDAESALGLLDRALEGDYSEALLVNTSLLASSARPELAVKYFARLVSEAPTTALRIAALRRAVDVWSGDEAENFPPELIPGLRSVLSGECPFDDYAALIDMAAVAEPSLVLQLPDRGGDFSGPWRAARAYARFSLEPDFFLSDLAEVWMAIRREYHNSEWARTQFLAFVKSLRSTLFCDFGDAPGSALGADALIVNGADLLADEDYFVLACQAGAHLSATFRADESVLNEAAFDKFFERPIERFQRVQTSMEANDREFVARMLSLTLFVSIADLIEVRRSASLMEYNGLNDRRQHDCENRYAIQQAMKSILNSDLEHISLGERLLGMLQGLPTNDPDHRDRVEKLKGGIAPFKEETLRLRSKL